ncbi:hypothetical protein AAHN97_09615 [Chitinophaga niabensis]|uniref:hypothetical protein n=1 Tax=Chitinophaga niabensis TaxID=536979 RepID=UPI0031BAB37C
MKLFFYPSLILLILLLRVSALSQVNGSKVLLAVSEKSDRLDRKIKSASQKHLKYFAKQEQRMLRRLQRKDTTLAKNLVNGISGKVRDPVDQSLVTYNGYLDSLQTAVNFLSDNKLAEAALKKLKSLQDELGNARDLEKYLEVRKTYFAEKLALFGRVKELQLMKKDLAKYKGRLQQYKAMLEHPELLERRLLEWLSQQKAFADFFNRNSQLSAMFRLPGAQVEQQATIAGLQTRQLLQQETMQRLGREANPGQMVRSQVSGVAPQPGLPDLREKLEGLQKKSHENELPGSPGMADRKKTFLQRIQLGTNFENTPSGSYFPAYTDIGLSVAYKLNEKCQVGIGGSGKVGWGKDIRHIVVTGQGASVRSFLEWRLKGVFHAVSAFEMNYNMPFSAVRHLYHMKEWTQSGLLGVSRTVPLGGRLMKETKVMLMWDFLSYNQVPRTQLVKFRIGYNFK